MSARRLIQYERLTAPHAQGGVLIEPAAGALADVVGSAGSAIQAAPLLDSTFGDVRRQLRADLGLQGLVILAGHQAEFLHPGVFAKSAALDAWADSFAGAAVYLTVDPDTPKHAALDVPTVDVQHRPRLLKVHIPGAALHRPMLDQHAPEAAWASYFDALGAPLGDAERETLAIVRNAWFDGRLDCGATEQPVARRGVCAPVVAAFRRMRTALERACGLRSFHEWTVSELAMTPAFQAFAATIVLDAARFRADYNAAQAAYRSRHDVRNPSRPAPTLQIQDGRIELPFWVWRAGGDRGRLWVEHDRERLRLFADDELAAVHAREDLTRFAQFDGGRTLVGDPWRLFPRALTLTAFVRLLLSDLFVHGIGGAKYDEMTEDFVARFWNTSLTPAACVTATLRSPRLQTAAAQHPAPKSPPGDLRERLRHLAHNPQIAAKGAPTALLKRRRTLLAELERLRPLRRAARRERAAVDRELRKIRHDLAPYAAERRAVLEGALHDAERYAQDAAVASNRELFIGFHPLSALRELTESVRAAIEGRRLCAQTS